jgi:hypothetical protein
MESCIDDKRGDKPSFINAGTYSDLLEDLEKRSIRDRILFIESVISLISCN